MEPWSQGPYLVAMMEPINNNLTGQKLRKMTSTSNPRLGSVWTDKLFEMINQEFQVLERKYQVLPSFGIRFRELKGLKVTSFRACVRSFYSVYHCVLSSMVSIANSKNPRERSHGLRISSLANGASSDTNG